jgi:hypothetical protein
VVWSLAGSSPPPGRSSGVPSQASRSRCIRRQAWCRTGPGPSARILGERPRAASSPRSRRGLDELVVTSWCRPQRVFAGSAARAQGARVDRVAVGLLGVRGAPLAGAWRKGCARRDGAAVSGLHSGGERPRSAPRAGPSRAQVITSRRGWSRRRDRRGSRRAGTIAEAASAAARIDQQRWRPATSCPPRSPAASPDRWYRGGPAASSSAVDRRSNIAPRWSVSIRRRERRDLRRRPGRVLIDRQLGCSPRRRDEIGREGRSRNASRS